MGTALQGGLKAKFKTGREGLLRRQSPTLGDCSDGLPDEASVRTLLAAWRSDWGMRGQ